MVGPGTVKRVLNSDLVEAIFVLRSNHDCGATLLPGRRFITRSSRWSVLPGSAIRSRLVMKRPRELFECVHFADLGCRRWR